MKIIDGKAYKEIKAKDLSNEELVAMIEDLQNRIQLLEIEKSNGFRTVFPDMSRTNPYEGLLVDDGDTTYNPQITFCNGINKKG